MEKRFLDTVIAAAHYSPIIKSLLVSMKYKHIKDVGLVCARLLYHTVQIPTCDFITAVPMHPDKIKQRGYNQAAVIAQELSQLSGYPYVSCLRKNVYTQSQASVKSKFVRQENAHNVFSLIDAYSETIANKSVLIIDDVCTTGTTLNECARVLKRHGATVVNGLVVTHKTS